MIRAIVHYDKEANNDLLKFNILSSPWKWIVYIIATVCSVLLLIFNWNSDFKALSIGLVVASLLLDLVVVYYYFISPKIELKSFKDTDVVTTTFEFTEEHFVAKSVQGAKKDSLTVQYKSVYRVYETEKSFYLFVDKYNTFIITKSEIVEGNENELRELLFRCINDKKRNKIKGFSPTK